jgi:hypothetical protein
MLVLGNLQSQLAELKVAFDAAILKGNSFEEVKKIYLQIKELELSINKRKLLLGLPEESQ